MGYSEKDNAQISPKSHPKYNDSSSSTLVWVPKERDGSNQKEADIRNVNLSFPDSHHTREPLMDTFNNEDDDDSTKWDLKSLSKDSIHDKECDVVHIFPSNGFIAQGSTSHSNFTSLRAGAHQNNLEADIE